MALDPQKRQKKVERKKAKEKAKAQVHKRQSHVIAMRTSELVSTAPILQCFSAGPLWDEGMGQVILSRELPGQRVAFSNFLLDTYCLGVKNAMFKNVTRGEYEEYVSRGLKARFRTQKLSPACARKLVEGGVEYARQLGFSPHPDYAKARLIFGQIDPTQCSQEFVYGRDGKPFFIAGPQDSPARSNNVIRTLHARFGADGYDFLVPSDDAIRIPSGIGDRVLEDEREG
ncbi:MAG: hypothetical protein ACOY3P_15200 [Planctomycetota bacterium]